MKANSTPVELVRLWIVVLSLLFPLVAALWAGALAEAILGDMEPMFIIGGTFVVAVVVALIGHAAAIDMPSVLASRSLRIVLLCMSIFDLATIPLCRIIVSWGRFQRERRSWIEPNPAHRWCVIPEPSQYANDRNA
jgi:hypothetical protein